MRAEKERENDVLYEHTPHTERAIFSIYTYIHTCAAAFRTSAAAYTYVTATVYIGDETLFPYTAVAADICARSALYIAFASRSH